MNYYLINAQGEQTIQTHSHGLVPGLAYSHPDWYEPKAVLAADFGRIQQGDIVILCRDSKLQSVARVDQVIDDHDETGVPVRVLRGSVEHRLGGIGVSAAVKRLVNAGIAKPEIINARVSGFKQGAFCERLTPAQAEGLLEWRQPRQSIGSKPKRPPR